MEFFSKGHCIEMLDECLYLQNLFCFVSAPLGVGLYHIQGEILTCPVEEQQQSYPSTNTPRRGTWCVIAVVIPFRGAVLHMLEAQNIMRYLKRSNACEIDWPVWFLLDFFLRKKIFPCSVQLVTVIGILQIQSCILHKGPTKTSCWQSQVASRDFLSHKDGLWL